MRRHGALAARAQRAAAGEPQQQYAGAARRTRRVSFGRTRALNDRTEGLKKIDREIAKYPADQKQSAVMSALASRRTSTAGCRTEVMARSVADYLGMPPVAVLRSRDVLHDVQTSRRSASSRSRSARTCRARCRRRLGGRRAPEAEARYRLRRNDGGRQVHAERGRVHGRMRRCPGAARQQSPDVQLHDRRQARRAAGGARAQRRVAKAIRVPQVAANERAFRIPELRPRCHPDGRPERQATGSSPTMWRAAATTR